MRTPSFWQRLNIVSALLAPLSLLYLLGAWIDRALTTPRRIALPVISIGNVTAGGAGKTPTTIMLAELLSSLGESPHILTRGYGGTITAPHKVTAGDDWRMVGDEALLLARATPCWVDVNRLTSAACATADGASLLLADDALQHHRLHKDISLLVIDGAYGLGNRLPLPAGPLRETLSSALARSHAVILIGKDAHGLTPRLPLPIFTARLEPVGDSSFLRTGKWLAFAGLGRPQKFFDTLAAHGATLAETKSFPDHHPYTSRDIEALIARAQAIGATLITTEKDAVKLPPALRDKVTTLKVTLRLDDAPTFTAWLQQRLAAARA